MVVNNYRKELTMARSTKITKVCSRTGFKVTGTPAEIAKHFYRDKSSKDGFSPWSKEAERDYNQAYRAKLKDAGVEKLTAAPVVKKQAVAKKRVVAKSKPRARKRTAKKVA
jgi:hypothetical protein